MTAGLHPVRLQDARKGLAPGSAERRQEPAAPIASAGI